MKITENDMSKKVAEHNAETTEKPKEPHEGLIAIFASIISIFYIFIMWIVGRSCVELIKLMFNMNTHVYVDIGLSAVFGWLVYKHSGIND